MDAHKLGKLQRLRSGTREHAFILLLHSLTGQVGKFLSTVANSRETNKQPQLQKQAQNKPNIFFDDKYHQYYL